MDLNFRTLRANEIEVREGNATKNGYKTLLLYKDARVDMALLDEVVKPMNWKREHTRDNANCIVSIWDDEKKQWVSKEDTGKESRTEAEKGLASDSFKRACFNWGIGRELYTAPKIFINQNISTYDLRVSEIEYNEQREITHLVIVNKDGAVIWPQTKVALAAPVVKKGGAIYPAKEPQQPVPEKPQEKPSQEELDELWNNLSEREMNEYNEALKQMKAATDHAGAINVFNRYKSANFAALLIDYGTKLKKERGW